MKRGGRRLSRICGDIPNVPLCCGRSNKCGGAAAATEAGQQHQPSLGGATRTELCQQRIKIHEAGWVLRLLSVGSRAKQCFHDG